MVSLRILGLSMVAAAALAGASALNACGSDDDAGGDTPGDLDGGSGSEVSLLPDGAIAPVPSEFGLDKRPANTTCKAPARPPSSAPVKLQQVFNGAPLNQPMMMAQIPGDKNRWFVAQRGGNADAQNNNGTASIVSFDIATPTTVTPVGSVSPVNDLGSEGGLLGLAFHPKFAQNGRLFVTWTTSGGANNLRSVVGYLTSSKTGATYDGVTFSGYTEIFGFDQTTAGNHKGGGIAFGKDGFLYVSFGDGGNGDDFFHNGQNKNAPLAKILRLDVDNPAGGKMYGIPPTNPFAAGGGLPEIFAMGFRNPYRFSIDRDTNEVWVGDVGQNAFEEIDAKVKVGGNYGWPCREGMHDSVGPLINPANATDPTKCPQFVPDGGTPGLTEPVTEHHHVPANSRAITGGIVYRGALIKDFVGSYIYGDYVKQEIWTLSFDPGTGAAIDTQLDNVAAPAANWVSFAEDNDGEIYALALNQGQIFKLLPAGTQPTNTFPDRLSKTGCTDPADVKKPASGLVPYGVNVALWSDGATKDRWVALPDGKNITVSAIDGDFDFPNGTVLMKTFTVGGKKIETRLFIRHDDGGWNGYTYEWLDDQSDAMLLPAGKTKVVGSQTWTYPSRSDCVSCHSEAAGRSLGLELGQLNGDFVYPSTNRIANQLKTFDHIGMLSAPLAKPVDQIIAYPDVFGTAPVEKRARAYVHANCSNCHRPKGPGLGNMDLRFGTAFKDTMTCNVDPAQGDIGVAGAKLLIPGMPAKSVLALRPHSPAANRMPPLASSVVDDKGVKVLDDWITSVTACP